MGRLRRRGVFDVHDTHVIVDGHNVLHAWREMREILLTSEPLARESLIDVLERYQDASGRRVTVVFDGPSQARATGEPQGFRGNVEVVYGRGAESADVVIQRFLYKSADPAGMLVVSRDRAVLDYAFGKGARTMQPEEFRKQCPN